MSQNTARVDIGIWTEWPGNARWSNEGMTRLLGFLIEGAAINRRIRFKIVVPAETYHTARADLSTLSAEEGLDWVLLSPPSPQLEADSDPATTPEPETPSEQAAGTEHQLQSQSEPSLDDLFRAAPPPTRMGLWIRSQPPSRLGGALGGAITLYAVVAPLRDIARLPWRILLRSVIRPFLQRIRIARRFRNDPIGSLPVLATLLERLRIGWSRRLAAELRAWSDEEEFGPEKPQPLPAQETPQEIHERQLDELVEWTNANVQVEAWIALFPHFGRILQLNGRKAVVFPDAIPLAFPDMSSDLLWGPTGPYSRWKATVEQTLMGADAVITFSRHTARDHAVKLFNVDFARTVAVPHAPPDLAAQLPFVSDRRGTPETRSDAGAILRNEVARRNLSYLLDFPFEQVTYIVVSTQDRQTKNIGTAVQAVSRLLRQGQINVKLITTAAINPAALSSRLPTIVENEQMQFDILSIPDLPRQAHAALYHCAALTIHPSLFEGGLGPFPFYESVSVGTPCLMARGPHVEELLADVPELEEFTFDPMDGSHLETLVEYTLKNRNIVLSKQAAVYERLLERDWGQVSRAYAEAALGFDLGASTAD